MVRLIDIFRQQRILVLLFPLVELGFKEEHESQNARVAVLEGLFVSIPAEPTISNSLKASFGSILNQPFVSGIV